MRVEYRTVWFDEAKRQGWPGTEHEDDYHNDGTSLLYRFEDDVPAAVIGTDGGEPEDQSLVRDWRWVPLALQAAYALGWEHAVTQHNPPEATDA